MSELVVEELGGRKRLITLAGRAVPYQGVSWSVEQRHNTTWYPGVTVATQQALGPVEEPTEFRGMWKDAFIPGSVSVQTSGGLDFPAFARDVVRLFHDVCRSGTQVRVQWEEEVRTGLLTRFDADYDRIQDVRWVLEFTWNSRDGEVRSVAATEPVSGPDVRESSNFLDDIASLVPVETLEDYAARANAFIQDSRERVGAVLDGLRRAAELSELPATLVGNAETAAEALRSEAQETLAAFAEVPVNNATTITAVADILSVERWRRETAFGIALLRTATQRSSRELERRRKPEATKVVTVPEGSTLYDVSREFYQTPDFATFLAEFNGLSGALVPAGTEVVVPPKPRVQS